MAMVSVWRHLLATLALAKSGALSTHPLRIRALRQLSEKPMVFSIDNFVDVETCQALEEGEAHASFQQAVGQFATLVGSELFEGQWGAGDRLMYATTTTDRYAEGLHLDTNNGQTFRTVTAILYLTDVAEDAGGATCFPLAGLDAGHAALEAADRLLAAGVMHTRGERGSSGLTGTSQVDAATLEGLEHGEMLRVQPVAGKLCIFFSRTDDGEVDPAAWHGGEELLASVDENRVKRICTIFKELDYEGKPRAETYEASYGAPQISRQRQHLLGIARNHAQFFEPS